MGHIRDLKALRSITSITAGQAWFSQHFPDFLSAGPSPLWHLCIPRVAMPSLQCPAKPSQGGGEILQDK